MTISKTCPPQGKSSANALSIAAIVQMTMQVWRQNRQQTILKAEILAWSWHSSVGDLTHTGSLPQRRPSPSEPLRTESAYLFDMRLHMLVRM